GGSSDSATDDEGSQTNVYPTQQFVFGTGDTEPGDHITTIDLETLSDMLTPEFIQQLLEQKSNIDAELEQIRQQLMQQMENQVTVDLSNLGLSGIIDEEELQRLIDNLNRMVAAVVGAAVNKGVIGQDELEELMNRTNQ